MFCTDLLEDVAARLAPNGTQMIRAQNIHVVCLGYLIRESFNPNRRLCVTLCPQEMNTFSENCNAGLFSLRSVCRSHDEITKEVQKWSWIRHAIEHECRKRVSSIQQDESPLLNRGTDIRAICLQSWNKAVPV